MQVYAAFSTFSSYILERKTYGYVSFETAVLNLRQSFLGGFFFCAEQNNIGSKSEKLPVSSDKTEV